MADDEDPTGMRHLLAGLKESGPMPAQLAARIRASLEDEQTARTQTPTHEDPAEGPSSFWSTMDDHEPGDGPTTRTRRSAAPWVLGAAAATVVALGVGGLMLRGSGDDGSSSDAAGADATQSAPEQPSRAQAEDTDTAEGEVPAFAITASGADYTQSTLADGAAKLLEDPTTVPSNSDDQAVGTLTTAAGATDCLARLGQPQMQAVVVDVAKFDGEDGLLLIAESLPDGPARAWAITAGCELVYPNSVEVPQK